MFLTQSIDLSSAVNLPFAYALTAHKDPEEVLPPNMNCYSSIYANSRATCAPHLRRNRASNRPFTFSIVDFGSRVLQFAMQYLPTAEVPRVIRSPRPRGRAAWEAR